MEINKNKLVTFAYCLMLLSVAIPVLFMSVTLLFIKISAWSSMIPIMFITMIPKFFLLFVSLIVVSFCIGLITKSQGLLLVSLIPIGIIAYDFYESYLLTKHPNGFLFDIFTIFYNACHGWLCVAYGCLVLIFSRDYFLQRAYNK